MAHGRIEQTQAGYRATVGASVVDHRVETVAKNTAATMALKKGEIDAEDVDWGDEYPTRYEAPSALTSGGFETTMR